MSTTTGTAGHTLQAARWVIRIGWFHVTLYVAAAVWTVCVSVLTLQLPGLVVSAAVALLAGLWAAVVRAFERHRRWSWWVLVVTGVLSAGAGLLAPGAGLLAVAGNVLDVVFVLLLLHPDSRDWVTPDPVDRAPSGRPGARPGARACRDRPDG
ncbi:hypothetical protein [Modestobacter roseus]|uniref:Uncharacterized protein n=1 Tax=Modestobacter roseus TaxID=1181884 RepID=A0A562IUT7_9ACTN|nr:hypothetical protein [Modestobacter roseus]MQA32942.1 hypothetical protein [Modestobacter roseus]TWH74606.1 hypothetical protein JD78_03150 [Modestobacter roseus]